MNEAHHKNKPIAQISKPRLREIRFFGPESPSPGVSQQGFGLGFTKLQGLGPNHCSTLLAGVPPQPDAFPNYFSGSRQAGPSTLVVSPTDRGSRKS